MVRDQPKDENEYTGLSIRRDSFILSMELSDRVHHENVETGEMKDVPLKVDVDFKFLLPQTPVAMRSSPRQTFPPLLARPLKLVLYIL